MYTPIHIDIYQIYDIFHNGKLIIIRPAETPLDIYCNNKKMNVYTCPHHHTYIYTLKLEYSASITLTIQNKSFDTNVNVYPVFKDEIILSTLVKDEDEYIKPWIEFHKNIGITRFIIYDNSDSNTLSRLLHVYIEKKQVILISWNVPYKLPISGISGQTTQQNHSIYAFAQSKYIGLMDIDEYVNMQHHTNIHTFFEEIIQLNELNIKQIGSFVLHNKFFYNPDNLPTDGNKFLNIFNCDIITKGNEKNFVIPQNVKTFSVHRVTDGRPMFLLDEKDIFFNHYVFLNKINRGKNITDNIDNSILRHINRNKTLIGKNGYLFLQNDSAKELEIHHNNLCFVNPQFYKKYESVKNKFLIIVFPNKSFIYSKYLPDTYKMKYRPGFDLYSDYFKNYLLDGFPYLNNLDTFYKTDTHINNKGALIMYNLFIDKINNLFNLNIINKEYTLTKINCKSLSQLGLGIGDLTLETNLGNQILDSTNDDFYKINDVDQLYCRYKFSNDSTIRILNYTCIDETNIHINEILNWNIVSNYILYVKNNEKKYKVIIFYDSFLISTLPLYMTLFNKIYFIKSIFDIDKINIIQPDYIFEFRCERFLF
jgi:hypothetical protein